MWNGNIRRDFWSNINRHSEKLQTLKFSNAAAIFILKLSLRMEMVNTRLRKYKTENLLARKRNGTSLNVNVYKKCTFSNLGAACLCCGIAHCVQHWSNNITFIRKFIFIRIAVGKQTNLEMVSMIKCEYQQMRLSVSALPVRQKHTNPSKGKLAIFYNLHEELVFNVASSNKVLQFLL